MTTRDMLLMVCTFDSNQAEEARTAIQALDKKLGSLTLDNMAVVEKRADGEIRIQDKPDSHPGVEQAVGAVADAVTEFVYAFAGLLGSNPVGPEATGRLEGSLLRHQAELAVHRLVHDEGFPDTGLHQLGEQLDAGKSALILLVKPYEEPVIRAEVERLGGQIMQHPVAPEILARLTG